MSQPLLVILAAGASSRLGQCKALASLGSRPALRVLLDSASGLFDGRPLVVTGAHHKPILEAFGPDEFDVLENAAWEQGRTGGLSLATASKPQRDFLVAPVDHPMVHRSTIQALLAEWSRQEHPARGWLAPKHEGDFGHPVIIGRRLLEALRECPTNAPLRDLRSKATTLSSIRVHDPGILLGLDTPADLARLREVADSPGPGQTP